MKKNKIIVYTLSILFFALLFSSCRTNGTEDIPSRIDLDDGTVVKLANNDAVDFYFYYPETWIRQRDDLMITIYVNDEEYLSTDKEDSNSGEYLTFMTRPNISAWVFTPANIYESIDEYWEGLAVPSLEGVFQDVASAVTEELALVDIPAKKYTYTLSSMGMNYKISQIVFLRNNQVYVLTYTAPENKYDTYSNTLNIVVDTFNFK